MVNAERCKFVMCDYEFVECDSIGAEFSCDLSLGGIPCSCLYSSQLFPNAGGGALNDTLQQYILGLTSRCPILLFGAQSLTSAKRNLLGLAPKTLSINLRSAVASS